MASKPKAAPSNVPSDAVPLSLLLSRLPAALVDEAMGIAIEKMKLTPEKLALILVRALNPDENIEKGEEADLRGIDRKILKEYKDARFLPEHFGFNDPRGPLK